MIITEGEAKTKWCPFARVVPVRADLATGHGVAALSSPVYNRAQVDGQIHPILPDASGCVASACMAWRPAETPEFAVRAAAAFRRNGISLQTDTGFCGLVGGRPV